MFRFYAFISYSSKDLKWGKRLQRKLERYKMPSSLCSKHGWKRRPVNPVFFAPTDIQPGDLSEELKKRLRESRHLIVICSPASAKSEWVAKEIHYFHELGRADDIHLFIVDGQPGSGDPQTECYNPIIKELGIPEILGANIHEKISRLPWLNKERAYVQLITKLLGVEFDAIWQRHKRQRRARAAACVAGLILLTGAMLGIRAKTLPTDVVIHLTESTPEVKALPEMTKAIVTMHLQDETKKDTVNSFAEAAVMKNVHRKFVGQQIRIQVNCNDYLPLDTVMTLEKDMTLPIRRDKDYYGAVFFKLHDPYKREKISNCKVNVGGFETVSDENGYVSIDIPLEFQKAEYPVSAEIPLEDSILTMPTNRSRALEIKY